MALKALSSSISWPVALGRIARPPPALPEPSRKAASSPLVLFGIATAAHVLSQRDADFLIVAVTVSMALTPLALMLGDRFIARLSQQVESREFDTVSEQDHETP